MSFMRCFTILRRTTKPCSVGLLSSKSALKVTLSSMAGHGAERRGKGPSHLTPAHDNQQLLALGMLLLLTCTISAATRFRQAANGTRSQRRPSRQAAACFYRKCSIFFITFPAGPIWSGTTFAFREKKNPHFVIRKLWRDFQQAISRHTPTGHWFVPTRFVAAPRQAQPGPGQPPGSGVFLNPILWGRERAMLFPSLC